MIEFIWFMIGFNISFTYAMWLNHDEIETTHAIMLLLFAFPIAIGTGVYQLITGKEL